MPKNKQKLAKSHENIYGYVTDVMLIHLSVFRHLEGTPYFLQAQFISTIKYIMNVKKI